MIICYRTFWTILQVGTLWRSSLVYSSSSRWPPFFRCWPLFFGFRFFAQSLAPYIRGQYYCDDFCDQNCTTWLITTSYPYCEPQLNPNLLPCVVHGSCSCRISPVISRLDGIKADLSQALVPSGLVLYTLAVFISCCLGFFVLSFGWRFSLVVTRWSRSTYTVFQKNMRAHFWW